APPAIDLDAEFDRHYQIGIAYKEMSLYQLAITELEQAVAMVTPDDQQHRFIHCCDLLGLCYGAQQNYQDAETWLMRGLAIARRDEDEYKALRYNLGLIYEASGRLEEASEAFFDIYAVDINFRRTSQKLKTLQTRYIKKTRGERRDQLIPVLIRG